MTAAAPLEATLRRRLPLATALLLLGLAPLLWLWPCVFGGRTFLPYDTTLYPPASLEASSERLALARDGANFDVTEPPVWFVPELQLARAELRAGRAPTWNPHARFGAPLHAHGLLGLCHPPTWLALLADDPATRLSLVVWANLALGGLLAFGLLRALGLPLLPAWFGALVFELSGPLAANAFFWMRLGSFVWLPGVLWGALAVADGRRPAAALGGLAVAVAMSWLAGFPPFALTTCALGGAFAGWLVLGALRHHGRAAGARLSLRLLAGFALGALLALPQLLPSARFFPHSARTLAPSYESIGGQAFERYGLLGYLVPDAISHPSAIDVLPYARTPLALQWNDRLQPDGKPALPNYNHTEYTVFVGTLALVLAVAGALCGRGRHRGFAALAWITCAGMALFLPGFRWLFLLPGIDNVAPMRWLAPATVFVAWLAALGLDRLLAGGRRLPLWLGGAGAAAALALGLWSGAPAARHAADPGAAAQRLAAKFGVDAATATAEVQDGAPPGVDRFAVSFARLAAEGRAAGWWLAAGAALLLGFAACRRPPARIALALAGALLSAAQLGAHGRDVTRGVAARSDADTGVHAFLRARAAATAAQGGVTIARAGRAPGLPSQLPPGQLMVPGLRDLHFYSHHDARSLQPLRALLGEPLGERMTAKGYLSQSLPDTRPDGTPLLSHPLLDLYGVRYVLATEPLAHAGSRVDGLSPAAFHVYERPHALPRAFVVATVRPHAADADVIAAMAAIDFAPAHAALALAADLPVPLPAADDDAPPRAVRFRRDEPTRVELEVEAGARPWLLLTDTWLPGWVATVDGVPAPIVRGDHAFRLVALPPSACRVEFRYHAPGLFTGLCAAAIAAAVWLLYAFATARRARLPR